MPRFALEDDLQGNPMSEAYAASALIQYAFFQRGAQVYALLANTENVAIGDKLESNGDGYLRKFVEDSSAETIEVSSIIGEADEALDLSSSSPTVAGQRILVTIW